MLSLDLQNNRHLMTDQGQVASMEISGQVKILAGILCLLALLVNNGIYISISLVTLFVIIYLFLIQRRPGVLIFAFSLQWVQVVAYIFFMNIYGHDINKMSPNSANAILLSNLGLLLMAVVVHLFTKDIWTPSWQFLRNEAAKINEKKLLLLYLGATLFLSSIGFIFGNTSAVAQILINIATLKWVFLLWLGFVLWINKKHRIWLVYIVLYEFSSGLFSYFSSFKEVLLYSILFSFTFIRKISFKQVILLIVGGSMLVLMFVTWSAVKSDYRNYLNQGTRKQVINVERDQAIGKLGEQIQNLNAKKYQMAMFHTLYRLQYILHLSMVMDRVPDIIAYQNGAVWWRNVSFVFTPRFLFPNKPIYDASSKTNYFAGTTYAGYGQGASFSLGYFADSYVDFGPVGMFVPLMLFAVYIAVIYRIFYKRKNLPVLLRFAIINVVLYETKAFESDGLYIFGRLLSATVVFTFLCVVVFPIVVRWVKDEDRRLTTR